MFPLNYTFAQDLTLNFELFIDTNYEWLQVQYIHFAIFFEIQR